MPEPEDLATALDEIAAALTAAGVRTCLDERDLNPPCAYVVLDRLDFDQLHAYTLTTSVYAVAPNIGRRQAYAVLGPLVDSIRAVWAASSAEAVDLTTPAGGDPLPAVRLSLTATVTPN